jgi:ankyrin repeat protein
LCVLFSFFFLWLFVFENIYIFFFFFLRGWAVVMYASQLGYVEVVKELLANGADVNVQSKE